ncbi:MAG: exonuclease subunit SbcD [Micromonosporaceae bacterium]|nr:exonuclease subunit SbcD [Micromonosporaceae bacterium]
MRVLHTSDWHLGRTFHGSSLHAEQAVALQATVDAVRAEAIDVVIVAGDLYDRQLPPLDAVHLLSWALEELRGAGAAVVAISGNHDSGRRLGFAEGLLARSGVHLWGDVRAAGSAVVVPAEDGGPDLGVYPIPYLEPEVARHQLGTPEQRTHDGLLRVALDRARRDRSGRPPGRTIAVAHAFVAGGTSCDSERVLRVGGSDRVAASAFAGFDYVALGHLHGRQVIGDGRIRYAGSPLPYSFSERDQTKGVWVLDLPAGGAVRVSPLDLPAARRLATLRGPLDDLLTSRAHAHAENCWVAATLTDQVPPREAMARLRRRFPHAVTLSHEPPVAPGNDTGTYADRVRTSDDLMLIDGFVSHVTGRPLSAEERRECAEAVDDAARGEAA